MRKVQQQGDQDCLASCIASLLDLPLGVVPVFEKSKDGHAQLRLTQKWLARLGFSLVEVPIKSSGKMPWRTMAVPVPCIVVVKTSREWDHAVVGRIDSTGIRVLHDPAPDGMRPDRYEVVAVMLFVSCLPKDGVLENLRLIKE